MININIRRAKFPKAGPKVLRDALRSALRGGGEHYKRRFLMLKFTHAAIKRYGLKPRRGQRGSGRSYRGSYVEGKVKRRDNGESRAIGENKPFVWSGETRSRVRSMARVEAKATNYRSGYAHVIASANQLNRAGTGKRINLIEEFERTAPEEIREVEKVERDAYDKHLTRHFARAK